MTVCLYSIC